MVKNWKDGILGTRGVTNVKAQMTKRLRRRLKALGIRLKARIFFLLAFVY